MQILPHFSVVSLEYIEFVRFRRIIINECFTPWRVLDFWIIIKNKSPIIRDVWFYTKTSNSFFISIKFNLNWNVFLNNILEVLFRFFRKLDFWKKNYIHENLQNVYPAYLFSSLSLCLIATEFFKMYKILSVLSNFWKQSAL